MADPVVTEGAQTEPAGTTVSAANGQTQGQSVAPTQTTGNGTGEGGESFFDYESIKDSPQLVAQYKEMQRAFGKKNETFKAGADKISQYDNFIANPLDSMRQLAQSRGYQLVQGQPEGEGGDSKKFENWNDVMSEAKRQVMDELQPMFGEMQNMKKQSVEQALDGKYADWRTYEDSMMENLQAHPTLVNDHDKLYQMSVPAAVLEARATKAALAKIQGTNESGTIQGQSSTTQHPTKSSGKLTFDQAVDHARQELKRKGFKTPTGE